MDLYYAEKCSIKNTGKNITGHFIKGDAATELMILQDHWQGKLQMIYLDPPFFTGNAFYFKQRIGEKGWEGDTKYIITHQAYSDQWIDRASFVNMLRQVLTLSHKLLKPEGSLFLHLDYRFSPHARLLMDEILERKTFLTRLYGLTEQADAQSVISAENMILFCFIGNPINIFLIRKP